MLDVKRTINAVRFTVSIAPCDSNGDLSTGTQFQELMRDETTNDADGLSNYISFHPSGTPLISSSCFALMINSNGSNSRLDAVSSSTFTHTSTQAVTFLKSFTTSTFGYSTTSFSDKIPLFRITGCDLGKFSIFFKGFNLNS